MSASVNIDELSEVEKRMILHLRTIIVHGFGKLHVNVAHGRVQHMEPSFGDPHNLLEEMQRKKTATKV